MSESSSFLPTHAALMPLPEASDALPVGTKLGEFEILEVVGVGGFGIVYRALEPALEREVALKEYMPMGLVTRAPEGHVALRSRSYEQDFRLGLKSFVNEARLLARFDHPALVKVHRFWEMNGTAYMAMPFYNAQTLRQRRQEMGLQAPTQSWLLSMIEPLLGALAEMHRADVYHRDIAPDNILWCDDNRPVLLDFGAARHVLTDRTQSLTAILKPQFAPIEQYADAKSMRQGPWTDVFALASTCYFMLTGRPPVPATARILSDELLPLAELAPPGFSTQVLATLDWAMSVRPEDRPQSAATFWDALHGHLKVPVRATPRLAAVERESQPARVFERTIQTSESGVTKRQASPQSGIAGAHGVPREWADRLRPDAAPDAASTPLRRRPAMLLLLGAAALAAGAGFWITPSKQQAAVAAASAPASSASAPIAIAAASGAPILQASVTATAGGRGPQQSSPRGDATPDPIMRAELDWAAAHEASAPAATPRPKRVGATRTATATRHASPRERCSASGAGDANACVKRLCASDSSVRQDDACAGASSPVKHWYQFWKAASAP